MAVGCQIGVRTEQPLIRIRSVSAARLMFAAVMCLGMLLMVLASLSYLELGRAHPFVLEKLPLAHPSVWLLALYVHVPSALIALPACLLLLVKRVRTLVPAFHRWLGRFTGCLVCVVVVPSGMYLAVFARGGWVSTLGFWLSGLIGGLAMAKSIARARARDFAAHRRWSCHVAAQLSVAVFSRIMLAGAEHFELASDWAYSTTLWLSVIACTLVAERLTGPGHPSVAKGTRHEELVAISALDAVR